MGLEERSRRDRIGERVEGYRMALSNRESLSFLPVVWLNWVGVWGKFRPLQVLGERESVLVISYDWCCPSTKEICGDHFNLEISSCIIICSLISMTLNVNPWLNKDLRKVEYISKK
jgi:hypothetical protein